MLEEHASTDEPTRSSDAPSHRAGTAGVLALALAACGATTTTGTDAASRDDTATRPAVDLRGGPQRALAANAAQANQLVGEGAADLKSRLAALRGHPIVVNQWGSCCPPCPAEFPYFAQMAATYQDRVAFLGLDASDARGAASQFLSEVPPHSYVAVSVIGRRGRCAAGRASAAAA